MAEQSERRWVWFSTPASVDAEKISVLAVLETLLAIGLTIGLAIHFETLTYIAITACIAPFMLLRTPESTEMGVDWFARYEKLLIKPTDLNPNALIYIVGILMLIIFSLPISILIKIFATAYYVLTRPVHAFQQITQNWHRMALRSDIYLRPEIVPGYEILPGYDKEIRAEDGSVFKVTVIISFIIMIKRNLFREDTIKMRILLGILILIFSVFTVIPIIFIIYGSALIYRYSLKSSSIIYFPLIYISGGFTGGTSAKELDSIRTGAMQRFSLYYALFILIILTVVPILAYSILVELRTGLEQQYSFANEPWFHDLVGYWIYAYEWKPLYAARAISAALTVALFFYADWEIRNRKFDPDRSDRGVRTWLGAMKLPRFVCVAYTTGFGLFTVVPYIERVHLPPFVWEWWPA